MSLLLSTQGAKRFSRLHRSLMCFVNERLQVVPDVDSPEQFDALSPETRMKVRDAFLDLRDCPRDVQEIAYSKGLIPCMPNDSS